jgi:hypothetical protein
MISKILITLIFLIELGSVSLWIRCQKLADRFYLSNLDSQLKLDELVRNDVGYSTYTARFFHNKMLVYGGELINKYTQFWDIRFDVFFFSIIGYFGILYGFWHLLRKEKKTYKTWIIVALLLSLPFIEIGHVSIPYWIRIIILLVPYYLFSLFGIWQFIKKHRRIGITLVTILILISIWYIIVFQKDIFKNFCYN